MAVVKSATANPTCETSLAAIPAGVNPPVVMTADLKIAGANLPGAPRVDVWFPSGTARFFCAVEMTADARRLAAMLPDAVKPVCVPRRRGKNPPAS